MYVNLNKTIQIFFVLVSYPFPPCNQCRPAYDEDYSEWKCVMSSLLYYNNGWWKEGEKAFVENSFDFSAWQKETKKSQLVLS